MEGLYLTVTTVAVVSAKFPGLGHAKPKRAGPMQLRSGPQRRVWNVECGAERTSGASTAKSKKLEKLVLKEATRASMNRDGSLRVSFCLFWFAENEHPMQPNDKAMFKLFLSSQRNEIAETFPNRTSVNQVDALSLLPGPDPHTSTRIEQLSTVRIRFSQKWEPVKILI